MDIKSIVMKKIISLLLTLMFVFGLFIVDKPVEAARKNSKKAAKGMNLEEFEKINQTIDKLTKKVYAKSLFSPQENEELIGIKIKLDNELLISQEPGLSQLYYKAGNLYKLRGLKTASCDCYQIILENFSETPFAIKAHRELEDMGIKIEIPQDNVGEEDEEE